MAKKRGTGRKEPKLQDGKALSRRDFFASGAAAGVGAAVLSGREALAQEASSGARGIVWNYEADVVVLGSGCVGLHAAVRARDLGASVLVIDQNFDVGGKLVHSGGWTSLGGGDPIQERDRAAADPDRLGLAAPRVKPADLEDDPDRLFRDMTDWSVVDETDVKAGTISPQDRGDLAGERHSPFNPMRTIPGGLGEAVGAPGWVWGGFAIARSLEFSAREKGVRFMLNRHMDDLIREEPFSGRVLGVKARYTPRLHPATGARLESFWQNGNIDERAETLHIRARKAVIVATGGMHGNVHLRTMTDPRMVEPSIEYGPSSLIGPLNMDGSGIIAGMKIGANLAGMMQNYQHSLASPTISSV